MRRITSIQSFGSSSTNSGNVTNSYNKTITLNKTDDEDKQIKLWLSPLEPRHRHQTVQANRVDGLGSWLLERSEFREWSGSQAVPKQAILWLLYHIGATFKCQRVMPCPTSRNRHRKPGFSEHSCDRDVTWLLFRACNG